MLVRKVSARVRSNGFVNILNRHRMALKFAGRDGTAIKNQSGNIQADQSQDAAGNRFVAADQDDEAVEEIAATDEFDRVGDDFAADQRGAHAVGAHGDAVRNGNRVELQRRAARCADAGAHVLRKFAKMVVARTDFDPGVRYADERLGEIVVLEPGGAKHGASRGAAIAIHESGTAGLQRTFGHSGVPPNHAQETKNKSGPSSRLEDGPKTPELRNTKASVIPTRPRTRPQCGFLS